MRKPRIGITLLATVLFAAVAVYAIPRAADALSGLDDPVRIASRALDGTFDAAAAQREIEAALAAEDVELAQSVIDLARARHVTIDLVLVGKVAAATAEAATMRHRAKNFARGLVTGEPQDMASLAGTTLGDLFVFGDIRDALREGTRYVRGEQDWTTGCRVHRESGPHGAANQFPGRGARRTRYRKDRTGRWPAAAGPRRRPCRKGRRWPCSTGFSEDSQGAARHHTYRQACRERRQPHACHP